MITMSNPFTTHLKSQHTLHELEMMNAALVSGRDEVAAERNEFKHCYYQVLEELRLARHHRFGASSEVDTGQGELFNIKEEPVEAESTIEPSPETGKTRRKPKRQPLSTDLSRVVIRHEPEETHCPDCGNELRTIGEDTSEKLIFILAKVEVEQHVRPKCVCRHCEQQGESTVAYQASMPATVFPKSFATPSLVAQVITMKFQYGLPLTRIASLFGDWGIDTSRRTLADWGIQGAEVLECVWTHLRGYLLKESALNADETPVKVVGSDRSKTYMWVCCSGTDGSESSLYNENTHNIMLYDHQMCRFGHHASNFLDGYKGYLHVDGYKGYHETDATLVGCWAHARRKFIDAQKVQGNDEGGVRIALTHIKKLYRTEALLKGRNSSVTERYNERQTRSKAELKKFKNGWIRQYFVFQKKVL